MDTSSYQLYSQGHNSWNLRRLLCRLGICAFYFCRWYICYGHSHTWQ